MALSTDYTNHLNYTLCALGDTVHLYIASQSDALSHWLKIPFKYDSFHVRSLDVPEIRVDSIFLRGQQASERKASLLFSSVDAAEKYVARAKQAIDAALHAYVESANPKALAKKLIADLPKEQLEEIVRQYQPEDALEHAKQAIAKLDAQQAQKLVETTVQEKTKSKSYFKGRCSYREVAPLLAKLFEAQPAYTCSFFRASSNELFMGFGISPKSNPQDTLGDVPVTSWVETDSTQSPTLVNLYRCK